SKIKENTKAGHGINDIYNTIIKNNSWFSEHSESIDGKKDMMNFNFMHLKNLYELLKGICDTITNCNDPSKTSECIKSANKCADSYRRCMNSFPWGELCSPYCSVLSNLKKDYENFREANNNKKDLPELKPPKGRENCENYCKSLTQILNAEKSTIEQAKQVTTPGISLTDPSVTLTSNDPSKTSECIKSANKCADSYRRCMNSFPWGELCSPYCSVLSNLKKDYENFREANNNKKDLPELKPPKGRENCENYCKSLTQILNAEKSTIEQAKQVTTPGISLTDPSVTLTSINNGNKLPYIAIPFILIPIILGISYKYLTPLWRKMMKKKTMEKIINLNDQNKNKKDITNGFVENI
ncbi:Plasmodium variant antigen protein Cir/Yir/Bir, putative, partial [Plasmodium chabaudi adami]